MVEERIEAAAQFDEAITACLSSEKQRREVVQRTAAAASVAIPPARGIAIYVQARRVILVERTRDLACT